MPKEDCELGDAEFPTLLTTDPLDALPPEVLFASPFELPHGLPSLTKTGTATLLGELCNMYTEVFRISRKSKL